MKKDEVVRALMFFSPVAKWEINPAADPLDVTYSDIIWNDVFYDQPTEQELQNIIVKAQLADQATSNYQIDRREAYPSLEQQLDYIFHNGVDAWKEKIQAIKDKYPKP